MTATVLSSPRQTPPHEAQGGGGGSTGENSVIRTDGRVEMLKGNDVAYMGKGDIFVFKSPGGG